MWPGHEPVAWDEWGRPWAFMNIGMNDLPDEEDTCFFASGKWAHPKGRPSLTRPGGLLFPQCSSSPGCAAKECTRSGQEDPTTSTHGMDAPIRHDVEQLLQPKYLRPRTGSCTTERATEGISPYHKEGDRFLWRGELRQPRGGFRF